MSQAALLFCKSHIRWPESGYRLPASLPDIISDRVDLHGVITDLPKPVISILTRKEDQAKYEPVARRFQAYFQSCLRQFPGLAPLTTS